MTFYYFGVEIEVIVEPHNKQQPVQFPVSRELDLWYEKIAKAMRNRKGCNQLPLKVTAESRRANYRGTENRHEKWWITWDGSLVHPSWPKHPGVPFEAVSPRLETQKRWEDEIDAFWSAMKAVFRMPRRILRCGSHVHVSPGRGDFKLAELQAIAFAVVFYDKQVQQVLPESRRDYIYCKSNKKHSQALQGSKSRLVELIQGTSKHDRPVLWNFHNVTRMPFANGPAIGTVEFRGGRCLRGPLRTKRWITFPVAFIILAIQEFKMPLKSSYDHSTSSQFWKKIRNAAATENMAQHLPESFKTMNESNRSDIADDPGDDYPFDLPNSYFIPQSGNNSDVQL
ncbi:amidoligase [Penicillium herquei]|nr:amidoligase [Penicillium herquei]